MNEAELKIRPSISNWLKESNPCFAEYVATHLNSHCQVLWQAVPEYSFP
jgi:hypothetical protein